jgi:hypothetical protein
MVPAEARDLQLASSYAEHTDAGHVADDAHAPDDIFAAVGVAHSVDPDVPSCFADLCVCRGLAIARSVLAEVERPAATCTAGAGCYCRARHNCGAPVPRIIAYEMHLSDAVDTALRLSAEGRDPKRLADTHDLARLRPLQVRNEGRQWDDIVTYIPFGHEPVWAIDVDETGIARLVCPRAHRSGAGGDAAALGKHDTECWICNALRLREVIPLRYRGCDDAAPAPRAPEADQAAPADRPARRARPAIGEAIRLQRLLAERDELPPSTRARRGRRTASASCAFQAAALSAIDGAADGGEFSVDTRAGVVRARKDGPRCARADACPCVGQRVCIERDRAVLVTCTVGCRIAFHRSCWRAAGVALPYGAQDADLTLQCLTPDCWGLVDRVASMRPSAPNKPVIEWTRRHAVGRMPMSAGHEDAEGRASSSSPSAPVATDRDLAHGERKEEAHKPVRPDAAEPEPRSFRGGERDGDAAAPDGVAPERARGGAPQTVDTSDGACEPDMRHVYASAVALRAKADKSVAVPKAARAQRGPRPAKGQRARARTKAALTRLVLDGDGNEHNRPAPLVPVTILRRPSSPPPDAPATRGILSPSARPWYPSSVRHDNNASSSPKTPTVTQPDEDDDLWAIPSRVA